MHQFKERGHISRYTIVGLFRKVEFGNITQFALS